MLDDINEVTNNVPESAPGQESGAEAPDVKQLEQALAAEKEKAAEYLASWQRAQADFINFKRRSEQERLELNKFAAYRAFLAVLPVLDDLERAIAAIPHKLAHHNWVEGVRLVQRKFLTVLEGQGVKPILALGMAFDPNFHEAVRSDAGPDGTVIMELEKGYTLNDKVLRPSKVVVGNGQQAPPEGESEEPPAAEKVE
jgi:molecular chaperone GrpE